MRTMSFKAKCQQCGKTFDAERSTAQFCSNACRQLTHRKRHPQPPGKMGRPPKPRPPAPKVSAAPERLRAAIKYVRAMIKPA